MKPSFGWALYHAIMGVEAWHSGFHLEESVAVEIHRLERFFSADLVCAGQLMGIRGGRDKGIEYCSCAPDLRVGIGK